METLEVGDRVKNMSKMGAHRGMIGTISKIVSVIYPEGVRYYCSYDADQKETFLEDPCLYQVIEKQSDREIMKQFAERILL